MSNAPPILTLVAAPGTLRGGLWERTLAAVAAHAAVAGPPDWLADAAACDLPLAAPPAEGLGRALDALGLDHALHQAGERRRKQALIADMDSTMVQSETLDEIAGEAGIKDRIAAITARSMAGELDFTQALTERVGALAGLDASAITRVLAQTLPMPGAETLVRTMRSHGATCWLVSGGFSTFTGHFRERLGFHADRSNRLEVADGKLTGKVIPPILDRDAKLAALNALCEQVGITPALALAVGDGANDLAMIQAAGMGVAFQAKPAVKKAARFHANRADLTTLLYFQGYRAAEFTRP